MEEKGLLRRLRTLESSSGIKAVIDGQECILFCSNDYLGLSGHPKVRAASKEAVEAAGSGSGAAPLISGHTAYHRRLAEELAAFKGAEATMLFGSGYLANIGIIPALASEGGVILSDSLNHASIIDGCRLSHAETLIFNHCDTGSLEDSLKLSAGYKRRWIVTEGVFSMDGDIAPLPEIMELAKKHDATVILDDAHATGIIGETGRGTLEHFGLPSNNIIQMGTLGKALGSYGAFVAAPREVIEWLVNSARSFMFSTAIPPSACAAASAALQVILENPEMLSLLRKNSEMLRLSLKEKGLKVVGDGTPIIPLVIGKADDTIRLASELLEAGFCAPAIRPPTVPEGGCRIRFTVSALHTEADINSLVGAL